MSAILEQLGVDRTFFYEVMIFAVLLVILSNVYFKPFMKLFQLRHKRTVDDREVAEKLLQEAQSKLEEYKRILGEQRAEARKDYEQILTEAKHQEYEMLQGARVEAKKITQEAIESANKQRIEIRKRLESDIESLASTISQSLVRRHE